MTEPTSLNEDANMLHADRDPGVENIFVKVETLFLDDIGSPSVSLLGERSILESPDSTFVKVEPCMYNDIHIIDADNLKKDQSSDPEQNEVARSVDSVSIDFYQKAIKSKYNVVKEEVTIENHDMCNSEDVTGSSSGTGDLHEDTTLVKKMPMLYYEYTCLENETIQERMRRQHRETQQRYRARLKSEELANQRNIFESSKYNEMMQERIRQLQRERQRRYRARKRDEVMAMMFGKESDAESISSNNIVNANHETEQDRIRHQQRDRQRRYRARRLAERMSGAETVQGNNQIELETGKTKIYEKSNSRVVVNKCQILKQLKQKTNQISGDKVTSCNIFERSIKQNNIKMCSTSTLLNEDFNEDVANVCVFVKVEPVFVEDTDVPSKDNPVEEHNSVLSQNAYSVQKASDDIYVKIEPTENEEQHSYLVTNISNDNSAIFMEEMSTDCHQDTYKSVPVLIKEGLTAGVIENTEHDKQTERKRHLKHYGKHKEKTRRRTEGKQ